MVTLVGWSSGDQPRCGARDPRRGAGWLRGTRHDRGYSRL